MIDKISIIIADDHAIVREGISLILNNEPNFEVIGEAQNGQEALELIEKFKPHVAIIDISMPIMSGIEVTKKLKKYVPETKIIILSRHDNEVYVNKLLEYDIDAYILKDNAGDDLIRAIEEIVNGNIYLSPQIATKLISDYKNIKKRENNEEITSTYDILTSREREVLKLIAEGNDNKSISKLLRVSPKTVKTHRANIMKKLDIHKVNDLVTYAIKNGLIEL